MPGLIRCGDPLLFLRACDIMSRRGGSTAGAFLMPHHSLCRGSFGLRSAPLALVFLVFAAAACGRTSLGNADGEGGANAGGEGGAFAEGGAPATGGVGGAGAFGGRPGGSGGGIIMGGQPGFGGSGGSVPGMLTIDPVSASISVGQSVQLRATVVMAGPITRDVTNMALWSVSSMVASTTTDRPGRIAGLSPGEVQVVAEFMGQKAVSSVRIMADTLVSLSLRPSESTINTGGVIQFSAVGLFRSGQQRDLTADVTWTTSAPEVAPINHLNVPGLVVGQTVGATKISAQMDGQSATAALEVTQDTRLSIVLEPPDAARRVGERVSFRATAVFKDGTQRNVTNSAVWIATNPLVGKVERGQATCLGAGDTMVVVSFDGFSASGTLACRDVAISLLRLTPVETEVPRGTRLQYTATAFFSDGSSRIVTEQTRFSSSNTAVVEVTTRGQATAAAVGSATIEGVFDGATGNAAIAVF